jgi:ATP-binding cassette subfamily C protein
MIERRTLGLVAYFATAYPGRSLLMLGCLIFAGLSEGLSVSVLLPIVDLSIAAGTGANADAGAGGGSQLASLIVAMLGRIGLEPRLEVMLGVLVVGIALKGLALWVAMRQVGYTVAHVVADLRMKLITGLLGARWDYFISQPAGRFANAIGVEAWRAAETYSEVSIALSFAIQVLVYTVAALLLSWKIALAALVAGLAVMFLLKRLVQIGRQAGGSQTQLIKALVARLTDALQGIKPIKAMAAEDHLLPLLESETRDLNTAQRRQVFAKETLKAVQEPVSVLLLAVGLYLMIGVGDQPAAQVMVLAFIFYRMLTRFNEVQHRYQKVVALESAFWSLTDAIDEAGVAAEQARPGGRQPRLDEAIRFEGVSFGYGQRKILDGVSLTIPAGAFVGIEGGSGAGKTTIADLIIGLRRPQGGEVLLDGVPLSEVDIHAWRRQVGYVPQEMFLFHDSVYNNVVLGDHSIPRADVERALRAAGVWDVTARLPEGMDTVIGERGGRISGGERQRIALATALVRRPRLLLLDEVTTALDAETEADICATLRTLAREQVTIVAISHQPALMREAQILYRIKDGRLVKVR